MRERWIDDGQGLLSINTETLHIHIASRARKNYRTVSSKWSLYFWVKGRYGYMARVFCEFAGTMEEAMERAETMVREMYESIEEIL